MFLFEVVVTEACAVARTHQTKGLSLCILLEVNIYLNSDIAIKVNKHNYGFLILGNRYKNEK